MTRTNVPDIRIAYRYETMIEEMSNIFRSVSYRSGHGGGGDR